MNLGSVLLPATKGIIALLMIFCLPGLFLSYCLFLPGSIERVERLFLAVLSSLSLSALSAFLLLRIGGRLSTNAFFVATSVFCVAFTLGAIHRNRTGLCKLTRDGATFEHAISLKRKKPENLLFLLVGIVSFFVAGMMFVRFNTMNNVSRPVEFYFAPEKLNQILGEGGLVAESLRLPVVVDGPKEDEWIDAEYQILVFIDGQRSKEMILKLDQDASWNGEIIIPSSTLKNAQVIELELHSELLRNEEHIRHLVFWLEPSHRMTN